MPQAVCAGWEARTSGTKQGWRRRQGGKCQYQGLLREIVAVRLTVGEREKILGFIEGEMEKEGVEGRVAKIE